MIYNGAAVVTVSTGEFCALHTEHSPMSLKFIAYRCKIWFRKSFAEHPENAYSSYICVMVIYSIILFFFFSHMKIVNGNEVLKESETWFSTLFYSSRSELI